MYNSVIDDEGYMPDNEMTRIIDCTEVCVKAVFYNCKLILKMNLFMNHTYSLIRLGQPAGVKW